MSFILYFNQAKSREANNNNCSVASLCSTAIYLPKYQISKHTDEILLLCLTGSQRSFKKRKRKSKFLTRYILFPSQDFQNFERSAGNNRNEVMIFQQKGMHLKSVIGIFWDCSFRWMLNSTKHELPVNFKQDKEKKIYFQ